MNYSYNPTQQSIDKIINKLNDNIELLDILQHPENKNTYCKLHFKDCNHICLIRKDHLFQCNNKICKSKRISERTKLGMKNMSDAAKLKMQKDNTIHSRQYHKNKTEEQKKITSDKHKEWYWNNRLKALNGIAQSQRNKPSKLEISFMNILKKDRIPFKHQEVIYDEETKHGFVIDFLINNEVYVNIDGSSHELITKQLDDEKVDQYFKEHNMKLYHLTKDKFNLFIKFYKEGKIDKWKI